MSLTQLNNKLKYAWHNLTYDRKAEELAKQNADKAAALAKETEAEKKRIKELAEKTKKDAENKKKRDAKNAEAERRRTFSIRGLLWRAFEIILTMLIVFAILGSGIWGASLATNLNVYHSAPYRVVYAIWGFFFFWLVIPYTYIYRAWWRGRGFPPYFALVPLIPYYINNDIVRMLLGWMSFRPDETLEYVGKLKEWQFPMKEWRFPVIKMSQSCPR